MIRLTHDNRCRVFRSRVEQIESDLSDPALASVLARGGEIVSSFVVEDRGTAELLLVVRPPKSVLGQRLITALLGVVAGVAAGYAMWGYQ